MFGFGTSGEGILALATASHKRPANGVRASGQPRVDYLELQRRMNVNVIDYTAYNKSGLASSLRYLETQLRSDLFLACLGLVKSPFYCGVLSMSERVGIPFAAAQRLLHHRKPLMSIFTCWSDRQERIITGLNLFSVMDIIIVKCQALQEHFVRLGARPEQIHLIHLGIDHSFYSPRLGIEQEAGFVLSVGEPRHRDYGLLFRAAGGLPVKILAAASGSAYAREKDPAVTDRPPENVEVSGHFSSVELRELYARSQFVVLPLQSVPYSAGATSILEAMAMERAVIVTRSPGIRDYVIDGVTGLTVGPHDECAMREAIQWLSAHPAEARRMGRNARQRVLEEFTLARYVQSLADKLVSLQSRSKVLEGRRHLSLPQ